ncbi:MAG: amino acid adenylation domain-containing protein, partial [Ruminococcaceae bacterium]|nr:amino acid adenylation domain-containing protein [Oscillospiraceae bacterium]
MEFKLTSSQMNFYNKNFTLDSQIWNQGVMEVFPKVYSYKEINDAYNKLVETHDSLRVKLVETESGVVADVKDHEYINYRFWQVETEEELIKKAQDFLNEPTDRYGLLVDCAIFQTPTTSGVMINAHHIVVDGFSALVMSEHINNFLKDENFAPVIQKYPAYVEKEEKYQQSRRYAKSKEFWLKEFSDNPQCNIFPVTENALDFSSSEINHAIPAELFNKIKKLCAEKEISPASFFNAVNATYLRKKYEVEKFTIGVPVFNRTTADELNTIGLYMHLVPLVINVQNDSFINNAKKIEDSQMNLFRHQSFTQQDIKALLNENNVSVNQLFDIVSDFQEFTPNNEYEMRIPYGNALSVPIEMHIQTFDEGKHNLKIRYRTTYFSENEIQIMLNSLVALAENAIENPDKNIYELEMISAEEKQKLLYKFNSTTADYAKESCIHELFEEQVERTPDKVALVAVDKKVTYKELNEEANRIANALIEKGIGKGDIVGLMLPRKSYLLSALFGILKTGAAYLPIDMELPQERIEYMCQDTNAKFVVSEDNIDSLLLNGNKENPCVDMTNESLCYCIYTSGSTGQPKGVMARHRNVVNYISKNEHNIFGKIIKDDFQNIVSISTCSFDIFVTETIATLVNGLKVILADEQACRNQYALNRLLTREKGHFLQTTPTKLKALTKEPGQREFLRSVKAILLGGEAMEWSYLNELKTLTDAKIYNIYGVTEVPIWSAFVDTDTFKDEITIGHGIANTQMYIVDKYMKPTPVGVMGELCIAGDSVSAGYLNKPELTEEKFIDNPFGKGKLYKTGDHAYWREDGNIVFIGRKDFQVKIRGLRIELGEIESVLQSIEGIERAVVVVRKDNEDRQLLCAFYTGTEINPKDFRTMLSAKLPKYMVPHIFTHLEKMPMTASGKANRNALPEIDLENIATEIEYVAPTTKEETILTNAIETVLKIEKVSTLDNFFDLGGDSLKSIELLSKLEENGYTIVIKSIFKATTIQELAKELTEKVEKEETVEYSSVIPATAAQMRIYTSQMMKSDSTHYNVNYAFKAENIDKEKLQKAINDLIARHESLRTHFETINGVVNQVIDESATVIVDELPSNPADFNKPFDLSKSPLLRVGCNEETVIVSLHHIIVDGESMPVFFRELNELYMGRPLTDTVQYGEFAVTDNYTEENEKYWLNVFSEEINTLELPTDYQRPETQSFNGANTFTIIDNQLNESIQNKCKQLGITPYAYYMACYNILLSKYSGNEDICVGTPVSGRNSKFLNTIGMFVNTIALRNKPTGTKTFKEFANEVRENSINAIDNQSYPFNELVKKLNITASNRNPLYDVMFTYQSESMTDITFGDNKVELVPLTTSSVKVDMSFYILPRKEDVVLTVNYCTDLFKEETITKFIEAYNSILAQCLNSDILIKDISVLSEEEKQKVLNDFNNTTVDYAKDKCIHKLFEEQVERTPDKIALVASDKTLTYKELNEEANKFAHNLIEKGIGKGDIVGIKLSRTSKFMVSLLGILKSGAAYLPFDTAHPQNRIEQILSDSNAKLCITEENFNELLNNSNTENPDTNISGDSLCYCIYTSGSTGTPKGAMIQHKNLNWYMCALTSIYGTEPINMPFFTSPSVDLSVPSYFLPLVTGGTTYFYDNELLKDLTDIFNNEEINTIKVTPTHLQIILQHIEAKTLHNMKYLISGGESLYHSSCVEFLEKFGNHIEIHNEYGPTEATVSCVDYVFSCDDTDDIVSIGNPINNAKIYIVDKHNNLLPIGVTGELCIAGDGVCAGYLNNPELTEEKFVNNPFGEGKLYKTGDLAFWREDGRLTFVGRNDFQVKIRGLRIELGEIENAIVNIDGVLQCAVVVRKDNADRQLICAFYTGAETDARDFRTILGTRLPKYMIPHAFVCLDEMPLTSSGKISRNSLPEIDLESISTDTEYVAPTTKEEEILVAAIEKVLDIEKASVLDSFFNVGGDSITAIYLVSELEDSDYELSVSDIMQSDTLQELASKIRTKKETIDEQKDNLSATSNYEQNEVNGFIPFTPIMRAFLKNSNGTISKDYVHTAVLSVDCNEETVKKSLDILVSHHDILRGTFVENGIEILPSDEYKAYSFASINIADKDEAIKQLQNTELDDKLVKAVFCYTKEDCLLSITIHHFLIDLVSWEILMKDFTIIVKQLCNNEEVCLSAKTASFKYWNVALQEYSKVIPEENKEYWKQINKSLDDTRSFNADTEENRAEEYRFTFSKEISQKLISKVNKTYKTRTNEVLLTALGLAAGQISRNPVGIIVESHGRAELHKPIATEKTVGWFTTCYPVVINNNNSVTTELVNVKDAMRGIPKNGVEYLLLNNGFHNNANIKFNYYKNSISNETRDNKLVEFNGSSSVFPDMINVGCSVTEDILSVLITVPECMHKKDISKELGKEFIKQIEKVIEYADVLPATAAQMRIYTAHFTSDEPTLYNLSSAFKMENFDAERFENAVNQLIARHEGLRTSFENRNGQVFQIINDTASIKIEKLDSPNLSDFIRPFDLTKAPLMRVGYIDNTVIVDFHHIISDGSTFGIFYEEINELYMDRELPEAVQYREFAVNDTYTKEDEEYWLNEFEEIPDFELYTDFPEQEAKSDKGINLYTKIDQNLHENILIKCKEWGVTPYAYYMGCVSVLLSKYSGSEDVCVGVTSNGRDSKFLNTWGMFVNMLSIRTKPESEKTFKDFVNEIKNKSFNAIAHQSYPQQELLKKLNIRKPLYDVMFIYQSEKMTHSVIGDKKAELIPVTISTSRAPIMFYIHPREEDTLLRTEYLTDLFKAETIDKLIASYMGILTQALDEKALIKDISVLSDVEKEKLLNDFNNTDHKYDVPDNSTLYSLFEEQAEKNADKVCIKANDSEITFKDFKAYAERIDNKVREITNSEKSVIAVICERSFEMYGAVYGIIRGGNAYLPIDPNYPQERIDYILSNSNAKAVITQDKFCHLAGNVPCINATDVLNNKVTIKETEILANENDTAYVIYTSGSTGNPKGAKISHKSAINRILWMHEAYPLIDNDVILQKTPYTFDVSVWELFWWGIKGRTLCASKPDEHFLPAKILEETNNHKVTHLHFVPSVFDIFLTYLENNPDEQYKFNSVKYVFLSGEALTANSINRFYNIYDYNKVSLHNLYGPTECAVDVSYYDCVPTDIDPVPIGKPIYNTQLHIIDKYLNPTPIGVTGELCIAGVNVGQGYLNNEQLTNEKFIPNPFGEGKLYKTGDLAYWREDGQICYVGRMDNQIKLNGQRIELGEIENAIGEIDGVVQCAVIVRKDNEDTQHLCAFYTGKELDTKELRTILNTKLPRYMVPHSFTHLETMPLTSSGKINRNALPEIDLNNLSTETEFVAPTTEKEKTLTKAIASVLNIEKVSILDNFFDIGGDSLKSIELVSKIEDKGYTVNVKSIFEAKDIQNLAKELITKTEAKEKVEYSSVLPATAAQMRIYTAQMMKSDSTHYNVNYAFKVKEVNKEKLQEAVNELVARHESLRTHFETINGVVNQVIDESATVIVDELPSNPADFNKP